MLYHKYRPKFFYEIVGQEIIVRILKNYIKSGNIPHGYLFAGQRGTGKTSLARIYAKALNCLNNKEGEPCGQCSICQLFQANKFLDIVELDAASHRKIDNVRNLQEYIGFKPLQGKYKVFIIDEAHSLTEEAANALLKTLEEPPPHSIFILATTEPGKILTTILSRLQKFDFHKIAPQKIVSKLKFITEKEGVSYEEAAFFLITEEADGSLRDAETLLEKIILSLSPKEKITESLVAEFLGYLSPGMVFDFLELIASKKFNESIEFLEKIYAAGFDLTTFVKLTLKIIKQLLILKIYPQYAKHLETEKNTDRINKMKNLTKNFSLENLKKLGKIFLEADILLKKDLPLPLLPLELALIEYFELK